MASWSRRRNWLRHVLTVLLVWSAIPRTQAGPGPQHYVFAHYMVCFATYGENLEGYKREVREAQAAGIDGFALNVGAWSGPDTYYKSRVALIYDAAEQLGTGFKLFFSIDLGNTDDIVDMVSTYGTRSNSFRYQGRVLLSTFGQNGLDWQNSVFGPLRNNGIDVFFVPHFWPNPVSELPSYQDAANLLNTYSNIVDGLFLFGAAGLPEQLAQCNSNYTEAVHAAGKILMASFTPHYWGLSQTAADGGITKPVEERALFCNGNPLFKTSLTGLRSSRGTTSMKAPMPLRSTTPGCILTEWSPRFAIAIRAILSSRGDTSPGTKPASSHRLISDAVYHFYRTHPRNAAASNTNDLPVTTFFGEVTDVIYTTVILTAPAQLDIATGGTLVTNSLAAGMTHLRTPFSPGPQKFTLRRNGSVVTSVQGPDILSKIQVYDFFPASGCVYYPPNPPANLRVLSP